MSGPQPDSLPDSLDHARAGALTPMAMAVLIGAPSNAAPGTPHGGGRHRRSKIGKHRGPGFAPAIWPLAQRLIGFRPQVLTAAAVALALVSAATVHAAVQGNVQAGRSGSVQGFQAGQPAAAQAGVPRGLPQAGAPRAAAPAGTVVSTPPASPPAAVLPAAVLPAAAAVGPELEAQINTIIANNSAFALGVTLIDISAGNADAPVREFGVRTKFVAASTAKILAAAAYYNLVESGQASLTAPLGASTAGNQIRWMVQQSNNDSWALIMNAVGRQRLSSFAAGLGIQYQNTVNQLTAAEMARLLATLSTGRLLNPANTAQLLSYMQDTNYETLIPAAVPPGITVQHKYGLLYGNLHDAAILTREGRRVVLVVYTRGGGVGDMAARAALIRQLTGAVTAALF